jgi:hypothetical protein
MSMQPTDEQKRIVLANRILELEKENAQLKAARDKDAALYAPGGLLELSEIGKKLRDALDVIDFIEKDNPYPVEDGDHISYPLAYGKAQGKIQLFRGKWGY